MKNKAYLRILALVLVLAMGLTMAGCGSSSNDTEDSDLSVNAATVSDNGSNDTAQTETEEAEGIAIYQYFVSTDYMENGNGNGASELLPVKYSITEKEGGSVYLTAVKSLINLPETDTDKYYTALTDTICPDSITVEDGIAYVDFNSENMTNGTNDEVYIVDQIVYTLANSFEDISAVRFTIDGENAETLMGKVDVSEPIIADYL